MSANDDFDAICETDHTQKFAIGHKSAAFDISRSFRTRKKKPRRETSTGLRCRLKNLLR